MSPRCRSCRAVIFESGVTLCVNCTSRRKVKMIAGGIAAGVTVVLGVVIVIYSYRRSEPMAANQANEPGGLSGFSNSGASGDRPFTAGTAERSETIDDIAIRKCDGQQILRSVQNRNGARREREALELAQRFEAFCGRNKSLDIERFQAHESLEEWAMAESIAMSLNAESPGDRTYWAFRGRAHNGREKYDAALADLRQAFAVPDMDNTGFLVDYIVKAAEGVGEPCEAAFALRWLSVRVGARARNHYDLTLKMLRGNNCGQYDGVGTFTWSPDDAPAKGSIAGERVRVRIDPTIGTTLVTRALAAKAKLDAGKPIEVLSSGGLVKGAAGKADIAVAEASAQQVPVVIVDKIAGDVDAVIGASFLWRFQVEPGDKESTATSYRTRHL
jgi:hypothetical protein